MSYNITSFNTSKCTLKISKKDMEKFLKELPKEWRSYSKFANSDNEWRWDIHEQGMEGHIDGDFYAVDSIHWSSDFSGHTYDQLEKFFSLTQGQLKAIIVWEGGDSIQRVNVNNGVIKELGVDEAEDEPEPEPKPKTLAEPEPEGKDVEIVAVDDGKKAAMPDWLNAKFDAGKKKDDWELVGGLKRKKNGKLQAVKKEECGYKKDCGAEKDSECSECKTKATALKEIKSTKKDFIQLLEEQKAEEEKTGVVPEAPIKMPPNLVEATVTFAVNKAHPSLVLFGKMGATIVPVSGSEDVNVELKVHMKIGKNGAVAIPSAELKHAMAAMRSRPVTSWEDTMNIETKDSEVSKTVTEELERLMSPGNFGEDEGHDIEIIEKIDEKKDKKKKVN